MQCWYSQIRNFFANQASESEKYRVKICQVSLFGLLNGSLSEHSITHLLFSIFGPASSYSHTFFGISLQISLLHKELLGNIFTPFIISPFQNCFWCVCVLSVTSDLRDPMNYWPPKCPVINRSCKLRDTWLPLLSKFISEYLQSEYLPLFTNSLSFRFRVTNRSGCHTLLSFLTLLKPLERHDHFTSQTLSLNHRNVSKQSPLIKGPQPILHRVLGAGSSNNVPVPCCHHLFIS